MMRPWDVSIAATAIRRLRSPWKRQRTRQRPPQKNPPRILGTGHLSDQPFARAIDEPTDQARGECDRRHPRGALAVPKPQCLYPVSRNIEHPLKKILMYPRCNQFTDELANTHIL